MRSFSTVFLSIVLSLSVDVVFSQPGSRPGFIATDTSYMQVPIVQQDDILKSKEVKYYKTNSEVVKLTPKNLIEYGFIRGDTYSTIKVRDVDSIRLYFARRLTSDGKLKLFMIRTGKGNRVFALNKEELTELRNDASFHATLSTLLNTCGQSPSWIREVKFSEKSLKRAFLLHASCYNGIFPKVRRGIMAGYSFSSLTLTGTRGEAVSMGSSSSPFVGIFIDAPLSLRKATWSVSARAYFQKSSFHVSDNTQFHVQEYIANTTFVNVPVLFRYHLPAAKTGKYLGFGLGTGYYLTRDNYKYDAVVAGSEVSVEKTRYNSISQLQIGGVLSAGVNCNVMERNVLTFELQYQYGKGLAIGDSRTHSLSSVQLISSISF